MTDNTFFQSRKVAYLSLGCKLNFTETSSIGRILNELGYSKIKPGENPEVCIINTCSVTDTADKKSRQAINRLIRKYPDSIIIVTGCYAQLKPEEISKMPGVNLVLGANEKFDIAGYLNENFNKSKTIVSVSGLNDIKTFNPSFSRDDRTRYFLKVQDGCDYFCTYCTVPFARGRSRNGSIKDLINQVELIASEGAKEVVLTGVNIGDFGKSTGETFLDLIKALDRVEGIERFRISSIEPNLLTPEIIDFVSASNHFAPHFHIPLQSGDDTMLNLMHRRYDTALFKSRIDHIRKMLPHAFIGVDVIVGSRGETPELFENTYNFLSSLDISQLHVFTYSERPGTQALKLGNPVNPIEQKERHIRLQNLSDEKWKSFYGRYVGFTFKVLFENTNPEGLMHGFTDNYIRVEATGNKKMINKLIKVKLGSFNKEMNALSGVLITED
jgi:threonylcarbamoyladenosine tRNA methylthiotransferase MtaB